MIRGAPGVLANDIDADGDPITAVLITPPTHGEFSLQPDGGFIYVPDPDFFGTDTATYTANDIQPSEPTTVTFVVQPKYDPAAAEHDSYKGLARETLIVNAADGVLANDFNPDQTTLQAELVRDVAAGDLTLATDGSFAYAPQGFAGTTTFEYRVFDGVTRSSPATVTLIINTPPMPMADEYEVAEDAVLDVDAESGVLSNDIDLEGDPLVATLTDDVSFGTLAFESDGSFVYSANPDFSGQDSFTYTISDPIDAASASVTVNLNVLAVNDTPIGNVDQVIAVQGETRIVSATDGVLTNDFDVDSSVLTAQLLSQPNNGTITLSPDGSFVFVPAVGAQGSSEFTYVIDDGEAQSAPVTVIAVVVAPTEKVVINEIHYDPPDNTIPAEYVELHNLSTSAIDLSNWSLTDAVTFAFPEGTQIGPGEFLIVAESPDAILAEFQVAALGPWSGQLSNEGETVTLSNAAGERVDFVDYRQGFPWPLAAGGGGASMELIHPGLENDKGGSWRSGIHPTPGAANSSFAPNAAPQIRKVVHSPQVPTSESATTITAVVTDPNGVDSVVLEYQVVSPGAYIPALLPVPVRDLRRNADTPREPNPEYWDPANWTTILMVDDGTQGDATAGDSIFTAVIPSQAHRTLVRYRITVEDTLRESVRVPYEDDKTYNFAYFVYDGVPEYNGHAVEGVLDSLPIYHLIARAEDITEVMAYSTRDQIAQGLDARFSYNWPGTFFYDGVVYDHISMRLRGGNGRHHLRGKRSMRFRFNDGNYFALKDQDGELISHQRTLTTSKMSDNRLTQTYALNEAINLYLFNQLGVPASETVYVHWRVIDSAEEVDRHYGDFWGFNFIVETNDVRFLENHDLPKGNLYKLINQTRDAIKQQRYQAEGAVSDGSDHNNIERNLRGTSTAEYIDAHVELEKYYVYHAFSEAIRHYDYWPDANKNMVYYFYPEYTEANQGYGKLWVIPWDTDASWGPTWNSGHDVVYNSIFPASGAGADSRSTPELWPGYFNAVREIYDLLWQPDQIEPLIEQFADILRPMEAADNDRWRGAPSDAGNYSGLSGAGTRGIDRLVEDMKNFAFVGGNWPGGSVSAGGRAVHLERLQRSRGEGGELPETPTISYVGDPRFAINGLRFETTPFADPQGNETFAAMEWRIAEITDPNAPAFNPSEPHKLEWNATWESGELTEPLTAIEPPSVAVEAGHTYRARVRMKDDTGRWSHWSAPVQFTATSATTSDLATSLRISELHFHPADPTATEIAAGFDDADDFEFMELANISDASLDLSGAEFQRQGAGGDQQGIDFRFADGEVVSLAPGQAVVVVEDLDAFTFRYGTDIPVAGQWSGGLNNASEQLTLIGDGQIIQQFTYVDDWHPAADGDGSSLEIVDLRAAPETWSTAAAWRASAETHGTPGVVPSVSDRIPGDSNGDGIFNSSDLVAVFIIGEYEDIFANNSTFAEGDWNGDGDFDSSDLVFVFTAGTFVPAALATQHPQTGPASLVTDNPQPLDQPLPIDRLTTLDLALAAWDLRDDD